MIALFAGIILGGLCMFGCIFILISINYMSVYKWLTSSRYRFFQKKISEVTKSLWELDFKISKARGMREASRQARDRAVEQLQNLIKASDPALAPKIEAGETEIKGYEAQMQLVDEQINGTEGPEGQKGLMEYMEGLADLKEMYKEYSAQL